MGSIAEFESPPVTETVLGIQFVPLGQFTAAHAGVYWHSCLEEGWRNVYLQHPLEQQNEVLDSSGIWKSPALEVRETFPSPRMQFTDEAGERMIQVQNSWFVYNWRKQTDAYPTYRQLLPEFLDRFKDFVEFVSSRDLGDIVPNQWEVTYVNRIPKGTVWNNLSEWEKVLPGLFGPAARPSSGTLETFNEDWTMLLSKGKGRMRVNIRHVRSRGQEKEEAIDFRLITRGPIDSGEPAAIESAFNLGHDAIVTTFLETTSSEAQESWGRTA